MIIYKIFHEKYVANEKDIIKKIQVTTLEEYKETLLYLHI